MITHLRTALRVGASAFVLVACALLAGCSSGDTDSPGSAAPVAEHNLDPAEPEAWVKPQRWRGYWTVYADVRDFIGEERWAALDTGWMAVQARIDLATVSAGDDGYADVFVLSGLWRLGLLRDEVLAALTRHEPAADWPIMVADRNAGHGWRIRVERWLRAQQNGGRQALRGKLEQTWQEAVAAADTRAASRVVEAHRTWLGAEDVPAAWRTAAQAMVRASLGVYLSEYETDWRDGRPPAGVIGLMERCGVPDGVDLAPVVAAAQHYYREMADETIPLPHPHELQVRVLRLQRLAERAGD